MANVRWNFRLGPLQFSSPFGVISAAIGGGLLVLCCCAGVIGAVTDGDSETPSRPVVNNSALATTAPASTPAQKVAPSPTKSTVVKVSPTPKRTTAAPKPTTRKPSPPAPKTDPRFGTCKEANANGYGPYVEGEDPEYDWYQDRDGDGIVCERS